MRLGRIVGVLLLVTAGAAVAVAPARFVRFSEARPILTELAGKLPPELNAADPGADGNGMAGAGSSATIARSARGSSRATKTPSSTGCCSAPRSRRDRARCSAPSNRARPADRELVLRRTIELISARLDDLLTALAAPGNDERRLFARALLQRRGLRFATAADRDAAREYLLAAVIRVANEQDQIDQELGATSRRRPASPSSSSGPGCSARAACRSTRRS